MVKHYLLPNTATNATTTMIAINPPLERLKEPAWEPDAPASESTSLPDPVIPVSLFCSVDETLVVGLGDAVEIVALVEDELEGAEIDVDCPWGWRW